MLDDPGVSEGHRVTHLFTAYAAPREARSRNDRFRQHHLPLVAGHEINHEINGDVEPWTSLQRWRHAVRERRVPCGRCERGKQWDLDRPRRQMPSSATMSSVDLPVSVASASTPRSERVASKRAERSRSSPCVRSWDERSGSMIMKAGRGKVFRTSLFSRRKRGCGP